jgi:hypothetical protein
MARMESMIRFASGPAPSSALMGTFEERNKLYIYYLIREGERERSIL